MHVEINPKLVAPSLIVSSKVESLEFYFIYYHYFDPPQIDVSFKIILISNTPHA
jgi:hypothetical protein